MYANKNTLSDATDYTAEKFFGAPDPTTSSCLLRVDMIYTTQTEFKE